MTTALTGLAGSNPSTTSSAYVYGGGATNVLTTSTTSYSYTPDTWSSNTSLPSPSRIFAYGLAISGLCYSWAGATSIITNTYTAQNDQMTPGSPSTWATKTAVTNALESPAATFIGAKGYSFCGFQNVAGTVTPETYNYEYTPSGDSWATKTAYPGAARGAGTAWTLTDTSGVTDTAYMIDGAAGGALATANQAYVVDTWASQAAPPQTDSNAGKAAEWHGGNSLSCAGPGWITGGLESSNAKSAAHLEYVPNAWTTRTNVTTGSYASLGVPA